MRPVVAVACGVLRMESGEVLIAQRPAGKIAAGKWEFPGGKIEAGETPRHALDRELREELGIEVTRARPLIRVTHDYSDRRVVLDTWLVEGWTGSPLAQEGQSFAWALPTQLFQYDLLAADGPILTALQLPFDYVFTPPTSDEDRLLRGLAVLPSGALLRLRLPGVEDDVYEKLAARILPAARERGIRFLVDRGAEMARSTGADGLHLTAGQLAITSKRPSIGLVIASCHNESEVRLAEKLGMDAIVLGPIKATPTHPGAKPLEWKDFTELIRGTSLPAYGIGGLGPEDMHLAHQHYAQGVAGISAYWRR